MIEELKEKRTTLLNKANELTTLLREQYSNIDITQPMDPGEKALTEEIAKAFSEVNKINRQIRTLNS